MVTRSASQGLQGLEPVGQRFLLATARLPHAAIVVSEVGVDLQHHLTLAVALASALANAVEPVTGASFVRWASNGGRWPGLVLLVLLAAGLSVVAFAAVANYMTAAGYGEFAHLGLSSPASVAVTQAYIALVVLVGWVLAQEVADRMSAVQDRDSARLERAMAGARREAAELGAVLADAATVNSVGGQVSAAVRARLDAPA